jgi:hypothetical protein
MVNAANQAVTVRRIVWNNQPSQWVKERFRVADFLNDFGQVNFIAEACDFLPGHLVEAGLDQFEVKDSVDVTSLSKSAVSNIDFDVFPNPSYETAVLRLNTSNVKDVYLLRITDYAGRELMKRVIVPNRENEALPMNFPAGIYLIQLIQTGKVLETKKWVKI